MTTEIIKILKVFAPSTIAFFIGLTITPVLTYYLYKYRLWKRQAGKIAPDGRATPIFNQLHKEREVGTPRLGGIIIWISTTLTILGFWLSARFWPTPLLLKLNFLSRNQTWLPLFTLIFGAIVGLIDDILEINVGRVRIFIGTKIFVYIAIGEKFGTHVVKMIGR